METKIKDRIVNYWTKRSENFAQLRQEELHSYMSELWLTEITKYLPQRPCKILDVGTGTGFFANLLAQYHHEVEGIDLTASMIEQAKQSLTKLQQHDYKINFQVMDAENLYLRIILLMSSSLEISHGLCPIHKKLIANGIAY